MSQQREAEATAKEIARIAFHGKDGFCNIVSHPACGHLIAAIASALVDAGKAAGEKGEHCMGLPFDGCPCDCHDHPPAAEPPAETIRCFHCGKDFQPEE